MKRNLLTPVLTVFLLGGCLLGCSNPSKGATNSIELPDAFKNTNFAYAGYDPGVALLFDENKTPEIENVSTHVDFYKVECDIKPLAQKGNMYFLYFKVTDQIIDDGYLKNNTEYKFWLSYENSTYFCGLSLNDESLTEPTITLMEGTL